MVAPTCFGITLPSSESIPSAFWEMINWGTVDRILWMSVLSGFGGLVVSMLASDTQDRGFAPGTSRRIFRAKKILRKGSKAVCPMSQICGMSKNIYNLLIKWQSYTAINIKAKALIYLYYAGDMFRHFICHHRVNRAKKMIGPKTAYKTPKHVASVI
jgi:hypothetical protein